MVKRYAKLLLSLGSAFALICLFQNCSYVGKPTENSSFGGTGADGMRVAAYENQVGGTSLNTLNVCPTQVLLTPSDVNAPVITLGFDVLQETSIPAAGAALQALALPQGVYAQVQLKLSDLCGTQRSIGIVNTQGAFNANDSVTLTFTGPITIGAGPQGITFDIQAIVNNLVQAASNSAVVTAATQSTGTVTTANVWSSSHLLTNAPSARDHSMVVWTGSKMLVWGGQNNGTWYNTGGLYDPVADSWTATSTGAGVPAPTFGSAVAWTGSEMIIWSGDSLVNTGSRYNPVSDSWTPMTTVGAPIARHGPATVWTGTTMLVWGGYNGSQFFNTGGKYNPATDSWTAITTVGAPPAAAFDEQMTSAVWTGSLMLVWGGDGAGDVYVNTGGQYNPATDSWSPISKTGAPSPRKNFTPLWTGTELIIWGGTNGDAYSDGARYNPTTDTWTAMSSVNAPPPTDTYAAVWTGSVMLVWGGSAFLGGPADVSTNAGWIYDPLNDTWTAMSSVNAPSARWMPSAVWTGKEMIIWGGSAPFSGDGGIYVP